MKNIFRYSIRLSLFLIPFISNSQICNYTENGKKIKLAKEKITITVDRQDVENAVPAILLAAAAQVVSLGIDVTKTALDNRAQSFSATYNTSYTGTNLSFFDGHFTPFKLKVARSTGEDQNKPTDTEAENLEFSVEQASETGLFRFKLKSLDFIYSKARITNWTHSKGKTVDINIDIQISSYYRDGFSVKRDSVSKADYISYTFKTIAIGESSITIQGVKPGLKLVVKKDDIDNTLYSDWFQLIPPPTISPDMNKTLNEKRIDPYACWYTFKVTVKEANPYGVQATQLYSFFKDNGSDISGLLKSFIPSSK
jgi:hypothetical protein